MLQEVDFNKTVDLSSNGCCLSMKPYALFDKRINRVLISQEYIEKRVIALAGKICSDYSKIQSLTVIVVLKGAVVFASDLVKKMYRLGGPNINIEFLKVSTYGKEIKKDKETESQIKIQLEPKDLQDKDILIVEDLIDQGFTMSAVKKYMLKKNVRSARICILLDKKLVNASHLVLELKNRLTCDYVGFQIPDKWVAGYGMDLEEDLRHLPFIVEIRDDYYNRFP